MVLLLKNGVKIYVAYLYIPSQFWKGNIAKEIATLIYKEYLSTKVLIDP